MNNILTRGLLTIITKTVEGLEASQLISYHSHIVSSTLLLPQLRAAAKTSAFARVVNILAAGQESTDIFLDDLTLKEPGHFNIPNYAIHAATTVTLTLKHISEDPENSDVVFIHAHPGMVSTDLFMKSWEGNFDASHVPSHPPGDFVMSSPEESGERCVYLITSAEYGGKGVAIPSGRHAARTLGHGDRGSLFSIDDKNQSLQQDSILAKFEAMGAPQKIWDHTFEAIRTYSK